MKPLAAALVLVLTTAASPAHAFPGVNLRWNACMGDGGVVNRDAACNSNLGVNPLVGSFVMAGDVTGVTGLDVVVDVAYAGTSIPPWFQFFTAGSCRQSALTANATIAPAAVNCADWAAGSAVGGLGAYQVTGLFGSNTARVKLAFGVPIPMDVTVGQEWFAFNLNINNTRTVGLGSCAGCTTPACIVFRSLDVNTGMQTATRLSGPTNGTDSNYATWQGAIGVSTPLGSGCPHAVPVRNRTWGELKSLYR